MAGVTPEDVRKAWAAHLDLDELKRLNRSRKRRTKPEDGAA